MVRSLTWAFLLALTFLPSPLRASASTATLDAMWRGTYLSNGQGFYPSYPPEMFRNFVTGQMNGEEYRSYFVFDLRNIKRPIVSANITFSLNTRAGCQPGPTCGFSSSDPSETITLFDYEHSLEEWDDGLMQLVTGYVGIPGFNDLGSGKVFGSVTITPGQGTATLALDSQALAALNANEGHLFAMGGALTSISGSENQFLFGASPLDSSLLNLTFPSSEVPEPTSLLLFGSGVLACAYRMRAKSGTRINRG